MQFLSDIWKHLLSPIAVCFQQMSFHSYNVPFCPIFGRIKFNIWDIKGRTYCIQWPPVDPSTPTGLFWLNNLTPFHELTQLGWKILITVRRNYLTELRNILQLYSASWTLEEMVLMVTYLFLDQITASTSRAIYCFTLSDQTCREFEICVMDKIKSIFDGVKPNVT